jgi:hypothetical protein
VRRFRGKESDAHFKFLKACYCKQGDFRMKMICGAAIALAVVTCFSESTVGATVSFLLDQDSAAGTWALRLKASIGDNGGIAAYGVPIVGQVTSLDHRSPRALAENAAGTLSGPVGFTLFRSPDGISPASLKIAASQDTILPTPFIIYGFGQTPGSIDGVVGDPVVQGGVESETWLATPLIASGTMTPGTRVSINRQSVDLLANVFIAPGSTQAMAATIVPEPSSMLLAALVVVVAGGCRRGPRLHASR